MAYWSGRITLSSTGANVFVSPGFVATWIEFSASDAGNYSVGSWDGTRKNYHSLYNSGNLSAESNDKVISLRNNSGTEVLGASDVSVNSTNGQYTITCSTPATSIKLHVKLGN